LTDGSAVLLTAAILGVLLPQERAVACALVRRKNQLASSKVLSIQFEDCRTRAHPGDEVACGMRSGQGNMCAQCRDAATRAREAASSLTTVQWGCAQRMWRTPNPSVKAQHACASLCPAASCCNHHKPHKNEVMCRAQLSAARRRPCCTRRPATPNPRLAPRAAPDRGQG